MCGIAGWVGPEQAPGTLESMTGKIALRGPDGDGHAVIGLGQGRVAALGHRRLSIIDLAGGAQPMPSHDDRFQIVFNGEIYNYVELRDELRAGGAEFATNSDTEVILEAWRAWGADALTRFRGMFAFALYDRDSGEVILARDPFGKKPVFFQHKDTSAGPEVVFASEIQALLVHPSVEARLNTQALYTHLMWRYVPGPATFFEGIQKLGPGCYMRITQGAATQERYWEPPERAGHAPLRSGDMVEQFLEIFDEAVRIRLRADVPLGAFLSGGLDSASIVSTLAHLGAPEIRTFSVGFRDDAKSELPLAAETAAAIGTIHTPVVLDPDDLPAHLPMLSRHRGAPVTEPADLPIYMMSMEAARHVKVVLSGEGADEMFAGYPKHLIEKNLGWLAPTGLLSLAGHGALAVTGFDRDRFRRIRIAAAAMSERRFDARMVRWFGAFSRAERDGIWTGPAMRDLHPEFPFQAGQGASPLSRVLHFDQTSWLPDNLLERMDMMTMAASIEARTPFMDVPLAEFAARLPEDWRIKGKVTKRIVREALGPRLPEAVIKRPKNGFRLPVAEWFRGDLRDAFQDLVLGPGSISGQYIDKGAIARIAEDHAAGRENKDKTLWTLYSLEIFLREHF